MKKRWAIAALTLIYLAGILWLVDLKDVFALSSKISPGTLAWVSGLAILANLFALIRSRSAIRALRFTASWRDIFLAFAAGNLATLAFNVFGQSLSRAAILQRSGVPFGITVVATYIERVLAAGILFLLSLIAVFILYRGIQVDFIQGVGDLIFSAVGIVIVSVTVLATVLRGRAMEGAAETLRLIARLGPSSFWTILGFGAGLAAYLVLFDALDHTTASIELVSALTIVMLATSLPISFAGFGLRELSAAATLSIVGIEPSVAVAASVLVGVIYIGVAGLFGLAALPLTARTEAPAPEESTPSTGRKLLTDSITIQFLALTCAVLIFFRVRVPVSDRDLLININVADIVVIVAFTVIALTVAAGRIRELFPSRLWSSLILLTGSIAVGIIDAFAYGHLGSWAVFTRGWGWVVILGYASLGAATVKLAGETGREKIAGALICATVTICALQLIGLLFNSIYPLPTYVVFIPLQGFARNQNAFAFDLAVTGVLLIAAKNWGPLRNRRALSALLFSALSAAMFLTESRTAIVFVFLLAALDVASYAYFRSRFAVPLPTSTIGVAAIFLALSFSAPVSLHTANQLPPPTHNISPSESAKTKTTRLNHPYADLERADTIVGGLTSWKESPIFGAGIGRYFETSKKVDLNPKSIHSIYVWFLSEMGMVGLIALLASAGLLTFSAFKLLPTDDARWGFTALGCLTLMGIGGLVQDFSYQRIFWFVLGLCLATSAPATTSTLKDRTFIGAVAALSVVLLVCWHLR
ncbi:lysylphosphatidylglycerol synthase domain-containing protein [Bradyrhizobium sp. SYSU BS000235]|uniref:lysylphosphatidylglycerol synthase domain-containing protein n=1 Tax=Bradyrhizobium sp. SYSU BS000235 TaxID=3411332 RepID=UPI003C71DC69